MLRVIAGMVLLAVTSNHAAIDLDAFGVQFEKVQMSPEQNLVKGIDSVSIDSTDDPDEDDEDAEEDEGENVYEEGIGNIDESEDEEDVSNPEMEQTEISDLPSPETKAGRDDSDEHTKNLPPCPEDQVIQIMKELHAINPEGVVIRATECHIERLCRKLTTGVSNIDHFMTTCDPSKDGKLYAQLIRGVRILSEKLCEEDTFQKEFLHYSGCYQRLREDFRDCVGPSGWSASADSEIVCDSYIKIANCFFIKTAVLCGKNGAVVFKELLKFVVGSMLTVECKGIDQDPDLSELVRAAGTPAYKLKRNMWSLGLYVIILLSLSFYE